MSDSKTINDYDERQRRMRKKLGQKNKTAVFAALAAADIEHVRVIFDGIGDSGQINDVAASRQEQAVPLPDVKIRVLEAVWGQSKPEASKARLHDAIEILCYDFLEDDHAGWQDNEGAFGEFRLDVRARTIKLEFNGRFIDFSRSNHSY
jgi:hypothetical protein